MSDHNYYVKGPGYVAPTLPRHIEAIEARHNAGKPVSADVQLQQARDIDHLIHAERELRKQRTKLRREKEAMRKRLDLLEEIIRRSCAAEFFGQNADEVLAMLRDPDGAAAELYGKTRRNKKEDTK